MKLFYVILFITCCLFNIQLISAEEEVSHVSKTYSTCPILERCQTDCQNFQNALDQDEDKETVADLRNILNKGDCSCSSKCEGLCNAFYNIPRTKNTGDAKNRIQDLINDNGCTCAGTGLQFSVQLILALGIAYLLKEN